MARRKGGRVQSKSIPLTLQSKDFKSETHEKKWRCDSGSKSTGQDSFLKSKMGVKSEVGRSQA